MKPQQENDSGEHPDEVPPKSRGETFGTWLRRQRVVREIELREIADASKISIRYLQALEDDRFEVLPAPVFAKGFLRQYAKYVGLDPEEVVNFFLTARAETPWEEQPTRLKRKSGAPSAWSFLGLFLLVAALLLGVIGLLSFLRQPSRWGQETVSNSSRGTLPAAPARDAAGQPQPSGGDALPSPASEGESSAPEGAATDAATLSEETLAPPANPPPQGALSTVGASLANAPPQPTAAQPQLRVTLDFAAQCWVEAKVDGVRQVAEMRAQGESLKLSGEREIQLKFGNIKAVEIQLNGRPVRLAPAGNSVVRELTLNLETLSQLAEGKPL